MLGAGGILALQGLGGFHLACDAASPEAVARLRKRKHRERKPLAVMVRDMAAAEALAELGDVERSQLASPEAPIVLAALRRDAALAQGVGLGLGAIAVVAALLACLWTLVAVFLGNSYEKNDLNQQSAREALTET